MLDEYYGILQSAESLLYAHTFVTTFIFVGKKYMDQINSNRVLLIILLHS